jgi:hypothetical protein
VGGNPVEVGGGDVVVVGIGDVVVVGATVVVLVLVVEVVAGSAVVVDVVLVEVVLVDVVLVDVVLVDVELVVRVADRVRSKRESVSLYERCASRTATMLVPFRKSDGAIVKVRTSSSPELASRATTGYIVVVDMLSRTASTPLTKTMAPSSATRCAVMPRTRARSAMSTFRRKKSETWVGWRRLMTVASPPFP